MKAQYKNTTERRRVSLDFSNSESLTEQCHKDEVKIQNIMRKASREGIVRHVSKYQGQYMDMVSAPDFYEAQIQLANAQSMFETVPAQIRAEFDNDPGKYIDFMQNPENRENIEKMGLDASHLPEATQLPPKQEETQVDIEAMIAAKVAEAVSKDA
ncbi:internal scaffolding protein [Microviridae sp.]|nr:internal scaffolding protein [Microviridae sp.]